MANKKVQIQIDTKATGNGAKQAEDALNKAAEAAERAAARQQAAAERAAQKAAEAAEKAEKKRIASEQRAAAAAEKEAKRAAAIVAREEAKKAAEAEKSSARMVKAAQRAYDAEQQAVAKSMSGRSQRAAQVGLQVQDIAVQAQMGVQATTILAQQGSQLAGAFGPQGAIIGGIIAIGSAATGVFLKMAKDAAVSGEAMEDMSDKLKEAFSKQATSNIEDFNDAIERTTSQAQSLREASLQVAAAQRERDASNKSLIDSQLKLDEAQIKYLASTGQIKDEEQALLAVRQKAAEETKKAQIAAAQNQVVAAQAEYDALVATRDDVIDEVTRAQKKLAEVEAQQAQLLQLQEFYRGQDRRSIKIGAEKEGFQSLQTQAASGQLAGIQKEIENLYKIIESGPQRLQSITDQSYVKLTEMSAVMTNAETQIAEIEGKFALSQKAEEITAATAQIGQSAQEITAAMNEFQPVTQAQADAKTAIQQAASDGIITAQEQQKIASNLQLLMSSIQAGQQSSIATLQELIQINNQLALKMGELNRETNALRRQVNSLQGIR